MGKYDRVPFITSKGQAIPSAENALIGLLKCDDWHGVVRWDEFSGRVRVAKKPPRDVSDGGGADPEIGSEWTDELTLRACSWFAQVWQFAIWPENMGKAITQLAYTKRYHPVRDYLSSLQWDGEKRVHNWLTRYAKVAASPYVSAVGSAWLVSAVARAFEPGCKVDNLLILEGEQRGGKSRLAKALVPRESWFSDTPFRIGSKDAYMALQGVWIYELAELTAILKGGNAGAKAFVSSSIDRYRIPYEKSPGVYRRTTVFIGTVNGSKYLEDETGAGRYWPVRIPTSALDPLDLRPLEADRDQLWAEARELYASGHDWRLLPADVRETVQAEQEERSPEEPWLEILEPWLRNSPTKQEKGVSISEALEHLCVPIERRGRAQEIRVGTILRSIGWLPKQVRTNTGARLRRYFPREK